MSGYFCFAKSNNALTAESNERYPLSRASKIMSKKLGWTLAKAKAFLSQQGTAEWHHSSKMYNKINYYNVSDEHLADMQEQIETFQYEKTPKKEKLVFFKCWNFDRDKSEPRKLDWSITSRAGNYTESLSSVKKKLMEIKTELEKAHKAGNKTHDRIFNENIAAIEEILSAIQ
jgi:hypothetical protein